MAYRATIFLDFGAFFLFEAPYEQLADLLPTGVSPSRSNSGKAQVVVNVAHFKKGGDNIDLPENYEIDIGVLVDVNNEKFGTNLPQATVATYILKVASTARGYIDVCANRGYPAIPPSKLTFDINSVTYAADISDETGPILSFRLLRDGLDFAPFYRIGQDVMFDADIGVHRSNFVFSGKGLLEQTADAFDLVLHDHSFFQDIGVPIGEVACVDQFALQHSSTASLAFYRPDDDNHKGSALITD